MNSSMRAAERMEAIGFAMEGTRWAISGAEPWTGSPGVGSVQGEAGKGGKRTHDKVVSDVDGGDESERSNERRGTVPSQGVSSDRRGDDATHETMSP